MGGRPNLPSKLGATLVTGPRVTPKELAPAATLLSTAVLLRSHGEEAVVHPESLRTSHVALTKAMTAILGWVQHSGTQNFLCLTGGRFPRGRW